MRALGIESAYSLVELVGEERALGAPADALADLAPGRPHLVAVRARAVRRSEGGGRSQVRAAFCAICRHPRSRSRWGGGTSRRVHRLWCDVPPPPAWQAPPDRPQASTKRPSSTGRRARHRDATSYGPRAVHDDDLATDPGGTVGARRWTARDLRRASRAAAEAVDVEHPPFWNEDDLGAAGSSCMTDEGCFTGLTALEVRGLPAPTTAPRAARCSWRSARTTRDRCATGVHTSRHIRPVAYDVVRGLRVADPGGGARGRRALGRPHRPRGDARRGAPPRARRRRRAGRGGSRRPGRPGGSRLRRARLASTARAESLWESLLRLLHVVCDIEVEPQWDVGRRRRRARGASGPVARSARRRCTSSTGTSTRRRLGACSDRRRDRRIDRATTSDADTPPATSIQRAVTVLEDADGSLGRPHDPARIRAWHDLLRDSLFTPAGRVRVPEADPDAAPRRRTA